MVAVVVLLVVFALPVALLYLIQYFRTQSRKELYDLSARYLEHGKEIPAELITPPVPEPTVRIPKTKKNNAKLLVGLMAISLGLAFSSLLVTVSIDFKDGAFFATMTALTVLFATLGLSFIGVWLFERRQKS